MNPYKLTVVILTKNEESQIEICLKEIPNQYRVIIVDSGSTDSTVSIAEKYHCDIYFNEWRGFANQRNFALSSCDINTDWVLFIDADEIYPKDFFEWFNSDPMILNQIDVLMVPSKLFIVNKKLQYAPGYPIYHPRLVKNGLTPFVEHSGHAESVGEGVSIGYGDIAYSHYFFDGDYFSWMKKHLELAKKEVFAINADSFFVTKRKKISSFFKISLLRSLLRFFYHYIFRMGFLDGKPGLIYSALYSWYELTKYLLQEQKDFEGSQ